MFPRWVIDKQLSNVDTDHVAGTLYRPFVRLSPTVGKRDKGQRFCFNV